jgi:hypothetical protein
MRTKLFSIIREWKTFSSGLPGMIAVIGRMAGTRIRTDGDISISIFNAPNVHF